MQRITITLDNDLATELDALIAATGSGSRSEAIRDLVRRGLSQRSDAPATALCYGVLGYVVDQSVRNLAARLPQERLDRHDQTVAALSVPLDHSHSVEIAVMRGAAGDIATHADRLFLERGVLHGSLGLIPVAEDKVHHVHGDGTRHSHGHTRVLPGFSTP